MSDATPSSISERIEALRAADYHWRMRDRIRYPGERDTPWPNALYIGTERFYELRNATPILDWYGAHGELSTDSFRGLRVFLVTNDRDHLRVCYVPPAEHQVPA